MLQILPLIPLLPLIGFVILAFGRGRISERGGAVIGVGSIGLSALAALVQGISWLNNAAPEPYVSVVWNWMQVAGFNIQFALRLDALSLVMMGVVTGVGFLIHLFAGWYMRGDEGFTRFFSYMNFFVAMMLLLVLGDNLVLLYLGWEGVGLASYLLIGFWYQDAANGRAARKAFIVTRVGDTFMAVGLFILFNHLGTLAIADVLTQAQVHWAGGSVWADAAALLLLGGAVGKSAQLPLQTWLPDAMAGPTPVSALIHAATMVTAGVYLVARMHPLFELSPIGLQAVGWVGGITLLLAGFTALTQRDIKRVLAYSTMSQIGYMFLALGAGAWSAAIFHLMTHAFFKALLFLAAGSVILACHHEQDIFKMGGLRKQIPFTFAVFLIGSLALVAFPGTAGFASKDEILFQAWAYGHHDLFWMGLFGAFLTGLYTFRLIFIAFFGEYRGHEGQGTGDTASHSVGAGAGANGHGMTMRDQTHSVTVPHGLDHTLPLTILAVLSIVGGMIHLPLVSVLPQAPIPEAMMHHKHTLEIVSVLVSLCGIGLAFLLFYQVPAANAALQRITPVQWLRQWWSAAFGFDWLYDRLFVWPYVRTAELNRQDAADGGVAGVIALSRAGNALLVRTQTGQLRQYVAAIAGGAVLVIAVILWL